MGCLWIIRSLKQIVVTGFAFNCNAVMAKLRIEIRREANCAKLRASHLCWSNAVNKGGSSGEGAGLSPCWAGAAGGEPQTCCHCPLRGPEGPGPGLHSRGGRGH